VAAPAAKLWRAKMQIWPRDVDVRRNMVSTTWMDFATLVSTRECHVVDVSGENETPVQSEEVLAALTAASAAAALRFATVVGGDKKMYLSLQGLPASADLLLGKPAFRG
jgi:hypothetical protein